MLGEGPLREQRCGRILPALLPAAEVLLRALDLRLAHWQPVYSQTMEDAVEQARCTPPATLNCTRNVAPSVETENLRFESVTSAR